MFVCLWLLPFVFLGVDIFPLLLLVLAFLLTSGNNVFASVLVLVEDAFAVLVFASVFELACGVFIVLLLASVLELVCDVAPLLADFLFVSSIFLLFFDLVFEPEMEESESLESLSGSHCVSESGLLKHS